MELADVLARFSCAIKNTTAVMLYIQHTRMHTYIYLLKSDNNDNIQHLQ